MWTGDRQTDRRTSDCICTTVEVTSAFSMKMEAIWPSKLAVTVYQTAPSHQGLLSALNISHYKRNNDLIGDGIAQSV